MSASSHRVLHLLGILILMVLTPKTSAHLGSCEDHSPECSKWETWGFCESNLEFMAQNCPVSCNICLDPGCFNRSPFCDSWEREELCGRYADVRRLCPHSCNLCQIPGEFLSNNTKSISRPDFECGKPVVANNTYAAGTKPQSISVGDIVLGDIPSRSRRHSPGQGQAHHHHDHLHDHTHDHHHDHSHGIIRETPINFSDKYCTPVLIHERFLLIAAHCVLIPENPIRRIILGKKNPVAYEVLRVIIHPKYNLNNFERYNDVALLEMKNPVSFDDDVYPSCLPSQRPPPGSVVTEDGAEDFASDLKEEGHLKIVHSLQCEVLYDSEEKRESLKEQYPRFIRGTDILCATSQTNTMCQNLSGLLFQHVSGRQYIVGLLTKNVLCRDGAISNLPGFYTSMADHIHFIDNIIYP